ncbi:MAG: DUF134 domain-containing protein [Promethearchaeota archaeon]
MGRPHKFRNLSSARPKFTNYDPRGMDPDDPQTLFLSLEEFEALRLRYYMNLKQTEAASKMHISQTTYSRILDRTYKKITKAFVEGYGISIQTQYSLPYGIGQGRGGGGRGQGQGLGQGLGQGQGLGRGRGGGRGQGMGRGRNRIQDDSKLGPDEFPMNYRPEKPEVVFKGYGCLNCGFVFQNNPESNGVASSNKAEKSSKPLCPECASPKTYRLIKKLTPNA